jgi:hypothetical protein
MIEPHVLHGGASSWFRMAANSEVFGLASAATDGAARRPAASRA